MPQKLYGSVPCCWLNPIVFGLALALPLPVWGQIVPDTTLGTESSVVLPGLIEGGAARGPNLFHSFTSFSLGTGQQVYFANPAGIENILGRITGDTLSQIDGTLGVAGSANLFLLNPNGFVFGPNAQLDLRGSFTASTADSLAFADGSAWQVDNVAQSADLLSISVPLGVQVGDRPQGNLVNQADLSLAPGQNLTFFGQTLDHSGSLTAPGGELRLLGDRVSVLDTASLDVSAAAGGGRILVGGDYQGQATVPTAQVTTVASGATLGADALNAGNGGQIIVWADEAADIHGTLTARGGAIAGNGGLIETSSKQTLDLTAIPDASAANGTGGLWLIDPASVTISTSGGPIGSAIVNAANINAALNSGTSVTITTDAGSAGNILQESGAAIRKTAGREATLTFATDNNILIDDQIISTSGPLNVVLQADRDRDGSGGVELNDRISANGGDVLLRGSNVTIGSFEPGQVSARTIAVNTSRLDIAEQSFLFATDLLAIEANTVRAVSFDSESPVVTNEINADIIAPGQISLEVGQFEGFITDRQGGFQTLRNSHSNDVNISSDNLGDFESEEFEEDEALVELEEGELIPLIGDRQTQSFPSYNLVSCRQSNFVISGRGGLPAAPNDLLSNREPVVPWVSSPGASSAEPTALPPTSETLTEAQDWITDAAGNVFFIAQAAATPNPSALPVPLCSDSNQAN